MIISEAKAKVYGKLAKSLTFEFAASSQEYKLARMFSDSTSLVDASELNLNDIIISTGCYKSMFEGCTSLTSAPKVLPATILASYCYNNMFLGCTSLTSAPELPATKLANSCYNYMFLGCTSLSSAPELPATKLTNYCYYYMFFKCSSLTSAPKLPATTLAFECYESIFKGCTKITELHYPKSIENDSTFKNLPGSPNFGADNATVYYDL